MMFIFMCISVLLLGKSSGYIYNLNGSDYARMPPLFHLDPYESCLHENQDSGIYCHVEFDLVTDQPSQLYTMIKEYSAKVEVHFNHTKLSHGICFTKRCKKLYEKEIAGDRRYSLEACLNETLWENYKLKARVDNNKYTCEQLGEKRHLTNSDIVVAAIVVVLLVLNLVGSLLEIFGLSNCGTGCAILSCFSIRRNWRRLFARAVDGSDPRLTRLTSMNGLRTIGILLTILGHAMVPFVINISNPHFFEQKYTGWILQVFANGSLVIQLFFVMSGFLTAYNLQIYAEKQKISWFTLPRAILARWLRLTPSYLILVAVAATWMRFFGSGPLWNSVVVSEVEDCQRNWWLHLLKLNNYVDFIQDVEYSQCLPHSWYNAADFQVFCVGLLVLLVTAGKRRRIIFSLLFLSGIVTLGVHTYLRDLDPLLMIKPEMARDYMQSDQTFIHSYKRGHTNLSSYVIGLATGLLVYRLQVSGYEFKRRRWLGFIFWLSLPIGFSLGVLPSYFYRDVPRASVFLRTVVAMLVKPVWGGLFAFFIVALVFQFEDVYRGVLEWDGWGVPARLSYCVYLIHVPLIKILTGIRNTTMRYSLLHLMEVQTSSVIMSFLFALPFHLLVEAPFLQLFKLYFSRQDPLKDKVTQKLVEEERGTVDTEEDNNIKNNEELKSKWVEKKLN